MRNRVFLSTFDDHGQSAGVVSLESSEERIFAVRMHRAVLVQVFDILSNLCVEVRVFVCFVRFQPHEMFKLSVLLPAGYTKLY